MINAASSVEPASICALSCIGPAGGRFEGNSPLFVFFAYMLVFSKQDRERKSVRGRPRRQGAFFGRITWSAASRHLTQRRLAYSLMLSPVSPYCNQSDPVHARPVSCVFTASRNQYITTGACPAELLNFVGPREPSTDTLPELCDLRTVGVCPANAFAVSGRMLRLFGSTKS